MPLKSSCSAPHPEQTWASSDGSRAAFPVASAAAGTRTSRPFKSASCPSKLKSRSASWRAECPGLVIPTSVTYDCQAMVAEILAARSHTQIVYPRRSEQNTRARAHSIDIILSNFGTGHGMRAAAARATAEPRRDLRHPPPLPLAQRSPSSRGTPTHGSRSQRLMQALLASQHPVTVLSGQVVSSPAQSHHVSCGSKASARIL